MNIYLLTQDDNTGYDTHDSIVVCAESEDDAISIDPYGNKFVETKKTTTWARKASSIKCFKIGQADDNIQRGVVITSFNTG